jgi:hypothetical protein
LTKENSAQIQKLTKTVEALLFHLTGLKDEISSTNGKLDSSVQLQKQVFEKVRAVVGDYGDANTQLSHTVKEAVREDCKQLETRLHTAIELLFLEQKKDINVSLRKVILKFANSSRMFSNLKVFFRKCP